MRNPRRVTFSGDEPLYKVDFVSGADLLMKKTTFLALGGFDEQFFMYCEELDLQLRLQEIRHESAYIVPSVKIVHLEGQSTNTRRANRKRIIIETSYVLLYRKHCSYLSFATYKAILSVVFAVRILLDLYPREYTCGEDWKVLKSILKS